MDCHSSHYVFLNSFRNPRRSLALCLNVFFGTAEYNTLQLQSFVAPVVLTVKKFFFFFFKVDI